jgi:hypothetical protein
METIYEHPWEHLNYSSLTHQPTYPISPLTRESIQQLQNTVKSNLPYNPSTLYEYTTRLTLVLLDTETFYSDKLCQVLPTSSPLWVAILISNTIKLIDPTLHRNEHIHPIQPISLVDYIRPQLTQQIARLVTFYKPI